MSLAGTRLVAGIDPAAHTGLVVLRVPQEPLPWSVLLTRAEWVASCRLNPIKRKALTPEQECVLVFERLRERLTRWGVREVAIECPSDAMPFWGGGKKSATGTLFAVGRAFERSMLAASLAGARVTSYKVQEWMPRAASKRGGRGHVQKRELTLAGLDADARVLRLPGTGYVNRTKLTPLSEDELMALGVLRYHLTRQR